VVPVPVPQGPTKVDVGFNPQLPVTPTTMEIPAWHRCSRFDIEVD
jgi:hypothetical protein